LRGRILAEEHRLLPAVVRAIAERRVVIEDSKVRILCGVGPQGDTLRSLYPSPRSRRRAMDTNFYDVIVCGGEIAGLCAGALLARRGFRVMVLGHEPWAAAFDDDGMALSAAPALLPPLDEPPTARVFKELDVTAHMKRKTAVADPAFRLVLPGQRLDPMEDRGAPERAPGRAVRGWGRG